MALSLRDHPAAAIEAGRAAATVEELEAELAARRVEAEQARVRAVEEAKQEATRRVQAEKVGRTQVAALGLELKEALQAPEEGRPSGALRGLARMWLHGGIPDETSPSAALEDLARHDPAALRLFGLHRRAGQLLVHLAQAAGLAVGDELFDLADDVECACWRGLLARVRVLAGEVEP